MSAPEARREANKALLELSRMKAKYDLTQPEMLETDFDDAIEWAHSIWQRLHDAARYQMDYHRAINEIEQWIGRAALIAYYGNHNSPDFTPHVKGERTL